MKQINSYIPTAAGLTLTVAGKRLDVDKSHVNYNLIFRAAISGNWDAIPDLINPPTSQPTTVVDLQTNPNVSIDTKSGEVSYRGMLVHNAICARIIELADMNLPVESLVNMLDKLYQNPSMRVVKNLYKFLESSKMTMTNDGDFIAYIKVTNDYVGYYENTHKLKHTVGDIIALARNQVNDNHDVIEAQGLHFCSYDYLEDLDGERPMVVKINPMDVVTIPDGDIQFARCCRYEVIDDLSVTETEAAKVPASKKASVTSAVPTQPTPPAPKQQRRLIDSTHKQSDRSTAADRVLGQAETFGLQANTTSKWFALGYTNGYNTGYKRLPVKPYIEENDVEAVKYNLTKQDLVDINVGYELGHKAGRGHHPRAYTKTTIDDIINT